MRHQTSALSFAPKPQHFDMRRWIWSMSLSSMVSRGVSSPARAAHKETSSDTKTTTASDQGCIKCQQFHKNVVRGGHCLFGRLTASIKHGLFVAGQGLGSREQLDVAAEGGQAMREPRRTEAAAVGSKQ